MIERPILQNKHLLPDFLDKISTRVSKIRKKFDHINKILKNETNNSYEKIRALKDIYKGKNAIIYSCGPSYMDYISDDHTQYFVDNDYIIICIKKSLPNIKSLDMICDFHINNFCNENKYEYNYDKCIPISLYSKSPKKNPMNKYDIIFTHKPYPANPSIPVEIAKNNDIMSFEKVTKPNKMMHFWGDIIHEMAIPLCLQLGINNILIAGWDFNYDPSNRNTYRKTLDKQHMNYAKFLAPFLQRNFSTTVNLLGNKSTLDIPKIEWKDLISKKPANNFKMRRIIPGTIWKHYKNKLYLINGVARHTETLEEVVVYRALYHSKKGSGFKDYQLWTRPKELFLEEVEIDGKYVPRFELYSE